MTTDTIDYEQLHAAELKQNEISTLLKHKIDLFNRSLSTYDKLILHFIMVISSNASVQRNVWKFLGDI